MIKRTVGIILLRNQNLHDPQVRVAVEVKLGALKAYMFVIARER